MKSCDASETCLGVGESRKSLTSLGDGGGHGLLEDRDEQVVLAPEIQVDRSSGHAGFARDVGDLRAEEAVAREYLGRRGQDAVAFIAARDRARQADGTAGEGAGGGGHGGK